MIRLNQIHYQNLPNLTYLTTNLIKKSLMENKIFRSLVVECDHTLRLGVENVG